MKILIDIVGSIILIFSLICFLGLIWDSLGYKNFRRYMIYKNIRKRHNKNKHRH